MPVKIRSEAAQVDALRQFISVDRTGHTKRQPSSNLCNSQTKSLIALNVLCVHIA